MYWCFWLIYTLRQWLYWMEDRETPWMHKYWEYEWLELWWQLYVIALPEWNLMKFEAAWFLLDRVYKFFLLHLCIDTICIMPHFVTLLSWFGNSQVCMLMSLFTIVHYAETHITFLYKYTGWSVFVFLVNTCDTVFAFLWKAIVVNVLLKIHILWLIQLELWTVSLNSVIN